MDSDSDFCVGVSSFVLQLSSADELFSDGKILPDEIRRDGVVTADHSNCLPNTLVSSSFSIWDSDFYRCPSHSGNSSALNCDVAKSRGPIRLLQFLSRSNSTGSVPNPKDKFASKDNPRQNLHKQPSILDQRWSSESYQSSFGMPSEAPDDEQTRQTQPPHQTIRTVSSFGLVSLFCNGKVKKKKKRVILINLLC
ncbi:hypothetical protein ACJRO7_015397 [Eucalyptus globulus]|uniref:Uncharacterized protein n=1 Tax=Eucalyptus globulus TaxID=34317 RepID=A0ABD3L3W8_EUCGL